jgi:hypothetical protein
MQKKTLKRMNARRDKLRQNKRLKQAYTVKDKKASEWCQACGTGYKQKGNLAGHVCTADASNNHNDDGNKTEPFKKSDIVPV